MFCDAGKRILRKRKKKQRSKEVTVMKRCRGVKLRREKKVVLC